MSHASTDGAPTGRVLVVDDDRVNRMLLRQNLEHAGHVVRTAENGREALDVLRDDPPDVVLLDIVMPELDGVAVLERLKADDSLNHLPVIMISAVDETESVLRCIEMGAEDYLPKPFDPVLLRARINAGLTKKRLHDLEHERVRSVFSRFVPEHVVEDVLERTDEDLRLGGSREVGTVMFTDIRGFTAFTEATEPQRVIELLNEYFGEMIDAIFAHEGTLVGYRGDGLLAVFGAPIAFSDHADRALAAAREMLEVRLPRFNGWLRDQGLGDGFGMGIGLNSGSFMSGNVGSARRLEYTIHGDTVNTASRLEGMTKELGRSVLLADATCWALSQRPDDLDYVGEFDVRGRRSMLSLWSLSSPAS
jgi:adenylate cyclase